MWKTELPRATRGIFTISLFIIPPIKNEADVRNTEY